MHVTEELEAQQKEVESKKEASKEVLEAMREKMGENKKPMSVEGYYFWLGYTCEKHKVGRKDVELDCEAIYEELYGQEAVKKLFIKGS